MILQAKAALPEYVYHGTVSSALSGLKRQLLNRDYWNPNRDFGAGFYTTISLNQAKRWASKIAEEHREPQLPIVLKIMCRTERLIDEIDMLLFSGPCREWSDFILDHRIRTTNHSDPCEHHPDIVIGLLADNRTSQIISKFQSERRNHDWFYEQICRDMDKDNALLDAMDLGNQICFCNENLMDILTLEGYYIIRERSDYDEYIALT